MNPDFEFLVCFMGPGLLGITLIGRLYLWWATGQRPFPWLTHRHRLEPVPAEAPIDWARIEAEFAADRWGR